MIGPVDQRMTIYEYEFLSFHRYILAQIGTKTEQKCPNVSQNVASKTRLEQDLRPLWPKDYNGEYAKFP